MLDALRTHSTLADEHGAPFPIEIVSDSTYVVNCFRDKWYVKWERNGWKNSKREPVANVDLWKPLDRTRQGERRDVPLGQGPQRRPDERPRRPTRRRRRPAPLTPALSTLELAASPHTYQEIGKTRADEKCVRAIVARAGETLRFGYMRRVGLMLAVLVSASVVVLHRRRAACRGGAERRHRRHHRRHRLRPRTWDEPVGRLRLGRRSRMVA